jgi:arylsulfatase
MATCVDVSGAAYPPASADAGTVLPLEGHSLLPAFLGRPEAPRTLIFEHEHHAAIRRGDWKLVGEIDRDGPRSGAPWRLFNLRDDPSEQHDLAAGHLDRVAELSRLFLDEARRTFVLPAP